jgi:uncharacterized heparinase superfamily protein
MISTWFHTVRYLRAGQVVNRVTRKVPRRPKVRQAWLRARAGKWTVPIAHMPAPLSEASRLAEYSKHYHYQPDENLVHSWIQANPPMRGAGWEPYPLSLRIVNWIKWLLGGAAPGAEVHENLAAQADYLSRSVEYHLLANHLFANAKALVFAGAYFLDDGLLSQGLSILAKEIPEQILPDGGHFERSPMYHSLVLEDVLDLVNLRRVYPGLIPDWSWAGGLMQGWLAQMVHPDGQISFFNDAAFGVAAEPGEILDYARRLGVEPAAGRLGQSGYVRLENGDTVVLFDAGPIGPDYQPGHAHADTLSFELSHRGKRVLVKSGTSTYENNVARLSQRGTSAHNTVCIDGQDSSEVWASFRVGRRARPLHLRTGQNWAEAAHDGYRPIIHRRRLELQEKVLVVTDWIGGSGVHSVDIYFHFHPEADAAVVLEPRLARSELDSTYYPGFEISVPNKTVVGRFLGECPVSFVSRVPLP